MTDQLDPAPLLASFARVVVGHDGDDFVLGRPDLGIFVAVPEPGAVFVTALQAGAPLAAAPARAGDAAGETVDGQDFLEGLSAAGLLDPAGEETTDGRGREIRWIEGVSPRVAAYFFGRVAWSVYAAATVFVVAVLAGVPALRPRFEQVWWLPDPVSSMLLLIPVTLFLGALHEAWHWLAGRALGVPATFRVSHRGVFLVFETDLTQIVIVPRRRRYAAFLAGMAFDATVLAVVLALRLADREVLVALPGWVTRFLAAVALGLIFRIVWQVCAVVLRSDMYAVLANALQCHDLYRATLLTTKDRLWRLRDVESAELAGIGDHDRSVARWFGAAYLGGIVVMLWFVLEFALPSMIGILSWVGVNLVHPALTTWAFWSSLVVALYVVARWLLPPVLAARERRLRKAGALR
jgi:putative peptide zinc metalloprotease protein